MRKFLRAQAQNQASIQKHLTEQQSNKRTAFHVESSSSEDDDNEDREQVLQLAVSKVVSTYEGEGGDTEKSLSYLTDVFQSGGATCLICISSVKKIDPIWSCSTCFSFMHLGCIRHWIHDSLGYKREKGIDPLWACPKCRTEYTEEETPKRYVCFCGQMEDPPHQPWLIPHSCGERCDKALKPACGHHCLLLCHPGPCPPCPKMLQASCFCGKEPARPRRCNAKEWSCGKICSAKLANCGHACKEECHPRQTGCPPCAESVSIECHCGKEKKVGTCGEADWRCDNRCGRNFSCQVHRCEGRCHRAEDCGDCPAGKNRSCPCGKKRYSGVTCKREKEAGSFALPTCGDTCGKLLDCGSHFCNMRCHPDRCGPCLEVVTKSCRCRSFLKEIACAKEFHCNKKCGGMRACGNHTCNRKCCDCESRGIPNQCDKLCDNTLNCQKHKCLAPCHPGPCYPCPRTNVVQCYCGNSKITVPCGRIKRIKPPNCNKMCKTPPVCHHPKRESHKCHYGLCPPCRKTCSLVRKKCGHPCTATCHTKVWVKATPKNAEAANSRDASRMQLKTFPCPPCDVSIMVTCLGTHETIPLACHEAKPYSCERPCGRGLTCMHHECELPCHSLLGDADEIVNCPDCERACSLPRPDGCQHPCPRQCHAQACYPCKQLVRVPCHCGINNLYKRCAQLTSISSLTEEKRRELLQCGNQCPKNYPCGHRCVENCHPGDCPKPEACSKRVKVWCACKRIKKDFLCVQVRNGQAHVECDKTCREMKQERERIVELEAARKRNEEQAKQRIEVERFERKFKPRRRAKDATSSSQTEQRGSGYLLKKVALVLAGLAIAIAWTVYHTKQQTRP